MKKIPLTRGFTALVSDEDYPYLSQFKWTADKDGYATRMSRDANGKRIKILMGREILGLTDPKVEADHIDRRPWNNQRNNLRPATRQINALNRRNLGVSYDTARGWYRYRITVGKTRYDGWKRTRRAAIRKANQIRKELLGGFYASPN